MHRPIESCWYDAALQRTLCTRTDDYYVWWKRWDYNSLQHLINPFVNYFLATVDLGEYRALGVAISALNIWAIAWLYEVWEEATFGFNQSFQYGWQEKNEWESGDALFGDALMHVLGIGLGVVMTQALAMPALFTLEPRRTFWTHAKYVVQNFLVLFVGSLGNRAIKIGEYYAATRYFRRDLLSYAMTKTLMIVLVYLWNYADTRERVRVYGYRSWYYHVVWASFGAVYASLLLACVYVYTRPYVVTVVAWLVALAVVGILAALPFHARERAKDKSAFLRLRWRQ